MKRDIDTLARGATFLLFAILIPQMGQASIRLKGPGAGTLWMETAPNHYSVSHVDTETGGTVETRLELTSTASENLSLNSSLSWLHVDGDNSETSAEGEFIQDTESMIFNFSEPVDLLKMDIRLVLTDIANATGGNGKIVLTSNAFTKLVDSDLTISDPLRGGFTAVKGAENEIIVENPNGFSNPFGALLILPAGVMINTNDSLTVQFQGTVQDDLNQGGQVDWFDVVHIELEPELPGLLHGYFDIPVGSGEGTKVTGRINPKANRNVDRVPINPTSEFVITGGTGAELFQIDAVRDQFDRMFGAITVAPGQTLGQTGDYTLSVDYIQDSTVKDSIQLVVHVVSKTQWEALAEKAIVHAENQSRMWGRTDVSEIQAGNLIQQIVSSGGILPGKDYTDFDDGMIDICNTIGGFARNLVISNKYGPNGSAEDRMALREALYMAYVYLYSQFPLDDFSENQSIIWNNRTHQWRYTDPLSGAAMYALSSGWMEDMESTDAEFAALAADAWEKMVRFLEVNWEAPSSEREPPTDWVRYAGFWADANRFHRMRSWISAVALQKDYNQPVTYSEHWYPYTSGPLEGFALLPGWEPSGSFFDLQTWLNTNYTPSYFYWMTDRSAGFMPDGTISHHTSIGQDIALWAYGYEWAMTTPVEFAGWFTGTPWEIHDEFWHVASEYADSTFGNVIYNNGHDMALIGRSFNSGSANRFGTSSLLPDLQQLIANKPGGLTLSRQDAIDELIAALQSGTHQRTINMPMWNTDGMIHRRGGNGEEPYYMSLKMISERTRGAEGFDDDVNSHHMADGFFQVKVSGLEYDEARFNWDWHVLPGTTVEWRTDTLPVMDSLNTLSASQNTYAGVVSDGNLGAAAFIFDHTNQPYVTTTSRKSYFFLDEMAVMVGSDIRRTSEGQGLPVVTTVDQASWFTDISYNLNESGLQTIPYNTDEDLALNLTSLSWFHQGDVGYVIWPAPGLGFTDLVIKTGANISDTDTGRGTSTPVFHIAINHGTDPVAETAGYVYAVIPNVTAAEMDDIMASLDQRLTVNIDQINFHSVTDSTSGVTQAAFFNAASIDLPEPVDLTVDQPAMVLLRDLGNAWGVAVSEPNHAPDVPIINVSLTTELEAGTIAYHTMGVWQNPAESVTVTFDGEVSTLAFSLPDASDAVLYDNQHEVYYGMPASIVVPRYLDPMLSELWGPNLIDWDGNWILIDWMGWLNHWPGTAWYYSYDLEWIYVLSGGGNFDNYFVYSLLDGWLYYNPAYLPYVYSYDLAQWLDTSA